MFTRCCYDQDKLAGLISRILSSHRGTGRRFRSPSPYQFRDRAATIDAWLQSAALDNLQELHLWYSHHCLPLPRCVVFHFSTTLRVVTFAECNLPDSTVQGLQFPQLKQLKLENVLISECSLHHMLAACPASECLLIRWSFGFSCVRINSLSLRSIGVSTSRYSQTNELQFRELVIDNAPCLKRLLHLDVGDGLHISVISAPKLETIRCRSSKNRASTKLSFGSLVIQGLHIDSLTTAVCTVQTLAIDMDPSLDMIINFIRCFPCLEKLYIEQYDSEKNVWRRKHRNFIRSYDIRLKTIVFGYYRGIQNHINFATFFVLNARVLKLMTFEILSRQYNERFLAEQQRKLQLDRRASRGAQFHFTTDRSVRSIQHACDLDLTDPFMCVDGLF